MKFLIVAVAIFCVANAKPSWGPVGIAPIAVAVPRHNQWGDIGPSGVVTGAGAAGPSGVVNGLGAKGPAGIVTGHGAVSLAGQSSAIRDDNVGIIGGPGIISAPILLPRIAAIPAIARIDDGRWDGDDGRWDDGRWDDGRWDDGDDGQWRGDGLWRKW